MDVYVRMGEEIVRIRPLGCNDGAHRVAPEHECDRKPLSEFCQSAFPCPVRDAFDPRGSSGCTGTATTSDGITRQPDK